MSVNEIIPGQEEGFETNTESSVELTSEDEAKKFFEIVKKRLRTISQWKEWAGSGTASFQLTDENGDPVSRDPGQGDHFKIDIPGPGSITGEGSDWVRIEAIEDETDCLGIRVRPATNPTNDRSDVAHFFDEHASSTFIVKRDGKKITAGVYGRNEKPNTDTEKVADTIRNTTVASGAIAGFSKLQWKSLVNGLVKN